MRTARSKTVDLLGWTSEVRPGCLMLRVAIQFVYGHGSRLIVPTASDADTIRAEIPTPSPRTTENSPCSTRGEGEKVTAPDVPHETLTSALSRTVNRSSIWCSEPATPIQSPLKSNCRGDTKV